MKDERLVRLGTLASNLMERVLLDTDILSEIFKRQDPQIVAHAMRYAATHQQFTFTAVSVHEVIYGLSSKLANRQLQIARQAFDSNDVIVPDLSDYEVAGEVRGTARRQGKQLAFDDCLIAAVAARLDLPLATGNTGHFQAVQAAGLPIVLVNWRDP